MVAYPKFLTVENLIHECFYASKYTRYTVYLGEHRVLGWVSIVPEHAHCSQVGLHICHLVDITWRLPQVFEGHVVNWEVPYSSSVLWTHITDGSSERERERERKRRGKKGRKYEIKGGWRKELIVSVDTALPISYWQLCNSRTKELNKFAYDTKLA